MSDPIRIRARVKGEVVDVVVLAPHPMETGMRTDEAGRLVAAHHITRLRVEIAARTVLESRMTIAVARDPLISFRYRGARAGDAIRVTWVDNRGHTRTDESTIA
jgi:sulfur-oxidizing protein SoxZ